MIMAPVDELHKYGFKLIGNFWELYRRDIPEEPGLYAFVACGPIKSVDWEISKIIGLNHTYNIFHRKGFIDDCDALTNDILYIGRAQKTNLRIRLDNYRPKGKKGLTIHNTKRLPRAWWHMDIEKCVDSGCFCRCVC